LKSEERENEIGKKPGLPDFSWNLIPKQEKITKLTQNSPNCHKISHMSVKYSKWPYNVSIFSHLRPSKIFTQIGISGLKINHPATLEETFEIRRLVFFEDSFSEWPERHGEAELLQLAGVEVVAAAELEAEESELDAGVVPVQKSWKRNHLR
jgi:hypothetical protein